MYEAKLRDEVSQGDTFEDVPITYAWFNEDGTLKEVDVRKVRAIVLSRDCDYDRSNWVVVAEVRSLDEIASGSRGNVRLGRTQNTFYLAEVDAMQESYVDFRRIDRLHKTVLQQLAAADRRLASLTDEARLALQRQIAIFFGFQHPRPQAPN